MPPTTLNSEEPDNTVAITIRNADPYRRIGALIEYLEAGPGLGADRWRRGTAGHTPAHKVPPVWREPEGPEGTARPASALGLATVPVGGGGVWPGFETTRRAEGS